MVYTQGVRLWHELHSGKAAGLAETHSPRPEQTAWPLPSLVPSPAWASAFQGPPCAPGPASPVGPWEFLHLHSHEKGPSLPLEFTQN